MIKNYILLAWRVLGRKKFFTFISLFGISFTLGILMVILSFLETELGTDAPWENRDRMVQLGRIEMQNIVQDTTMLVDSLLVSGAMKYDTTYSYGENSNSTTIGSVSGKFLLDHFTDLKNSEAHTFFMPGVTYNTYVGGSKVVLDLIYSDHHFWDIYNFEFLEGQGYDEGMFNRAEPVAVVTDEIADKVFGTTSNVIGREIKMDGKLHKVIGLVEKPRSALLNAGVWAPSTLSKNYPGRIDRYTGGYHAIFLAESPSKTDALIKEIENMENTISTDPVPDYNKLILNEYPGTMFGFFAQGLVPANIPSEAAFVLRWILIGFISLFVLLPTLNLINLNVSRIMERSSEIGVRKSFGASKSNILGQFIFENVILTIIGGIIGLVIALLLIRFINSANLLEQMRLTVNFRFFLFSFLIVIIFGVISGFLPAYRMSKIHIVQALKSNKI